MKRPLILFTGAFTAVVYAQLRWDIMGALHGHLFFCATVALFLFCACTLYQRLHLGLVLLAACVCGLLFAESYVTLIVQPIRALAGTTTTFSGIVQRASSIYSDSQRVAVKVDARQLGLTAHPRVSLLLYVPLTSRQLQPGDTVTVTARLYRPALSDGFDREAYYNANGVFLSGRFVSETEGESGTKSDKAKNFTVSYRVKSPVWSLPLQADNFLKNNLNFVKNPRYAGFTASILFGDTTDMDPTDIAHMRKAGLSHLSAVSGMNVAFLVGFLMLVLGRKYGSLLSIAAVLFFIPMAGASPSILRAGIMYLLTAAAFYLNRENDTLHALCAALLVLICGNPYSLYSVGLQLSFASSLGLILCSSPMQRFLTQPFAERPAPIRMIAKILLDSLTASFCTMLFTVPICMATFGYISVLAPLANLLVVGVIGFLFVAGLLLGVLGGLIPGLGILLSLPVSAASAYVLGVARWISGLPYGLVYRDNRWGMAALLIVYAAAAAVWLLRRRVVLRKIVIPACLSILLFTVVGVSSARESMRVHFLPCGTGQAVLAAQVDKTALIDCGASGYRDGVQTVTEAMDWYGYDSIDTLILTAVDKTHARNVPELLQQVSVRRMILPENVRDSTLLEQIRSTAASRHVAVTAWAAQGEKPVGLCGLSLIGGIDRKLMVRLQYGNQNFLILHSVTQKMLQTYLQTHTLSAQTLVLSESNIADAALLKDAMRRLHPQQILLESGYGRQNRVLQYHIRNTFTEGEILYHISATS